MYIPEAMKMKDNDKIYQYLEQNGFAMLVSSSLAASHLPFLLVRDEGPQGRLYFHLAKANAQWRELEGQQVLVCFQGPHSYISPTWYQTEQAVPTWNYVAIHCYGMVVKLTDSELAAMMQKLVKHYEPELQNHPQLMPEAFWQRQLAGIVGFSLDISRLEAKEKLGQHRPVADQRGTLRGLQNSSHPDARALAEYMLKHAKGTGE